MALFDGEAFGSQVVEVVRSYLDTQVAPLIKRLDELEQRLSSLPAPVEVRQYELEIERVREIAADVVKAAEITIDIPEAVAEQVASAIPDISKMVADAVAAIPVPMDGKSVTVDDVRPILQEMVDALPKAIDGKDGVTMDEVMPHLREMVAAIPVPKDGTSVTVEDLTPVLREMVDNIPKPVVVHGKDGLDVKDLFRAEGGKLIAVMSDGTTRDLGVFVGKDGDPGRDGFDLRHFDATLMDDGRTILLSFEQEGQSFQVELGVPTMIYRDYYAEGQEYEKGDTVTYGGNLWHCSVDKSTNVPGRDNNDWRLCAKKGRDGRDLTPKETKAVTSVPTTRG